jgi:hypothetical protein
MRIHALLFVATSLGVTAITTTAQAEDLLLASNPDAIALQFQEAGLQAKIDKDQLGHPIIFSAASGANFDLLFNDCTQGKDCTSVQFNACFDMPDGVEMAVVNKWNYEWRFGRVSVDDANDPCLQMDIEMFGGISKSAFATSIDTWTGSLDQFIATIDF